MTVGQANKIMERLEKKGKELRLQSKMKEAERTFIKLTKLAGLRAKQEEGEIGLEINPLNMEGVAEKLQSCYNDGTLKEKVQEPFANLAKGNHNILKVEAGVELCWKGEQGKSRQGKDAKGYDGTIKVSANELKLADDYVLEEGSEGAFECLCDYLVKTPDELYPIVQYLNSIKVQVCEITRGCIELKFRCFNQESAVHLQEEESIKSLKARFQSDVFDSALLKRFGLESLELDIKCTFSPVADTEVTCDSEEECTFMEMVTDKVHEAYALDKSLDRPIEIAPTDVTENSIGITWAVGVVDSYTVSLSPPDGDFPAGRVDGGAPLEYTFINLTPGTLYNISITTAGDEMGNAASTVQLRTTPAPPDEIGIIDKNNNSISITWDEAVGAKDSYRISISPADGDNPATSVDSGDPLEHTFTGLTPGRLYTISVTTVSGGVESVTTTKEQRTTPADPGEVRNASITENSIDITWAEAAGVKDSYIVSISSDNGVTKQVSTTHNMYNFDNLTPGTLYNISVSTVSGGVKSVPRTRIQLCTVPGMPHHISIADVTETSISITWTEAAGAKDHYRVSISSATGDEYLLTKVDAGAPLEHTFTGLTKGTLYNISVTTVGDGKKSVARTKRQRTSPSQSGVISIANITENSISITWDEAAEVVDSYDISISPPDGTNPTGRVNNGDPLEHTFSRLKPGCLYTISVTTDSGGEKGMTRTRDLHTRVSKPYMTRFLSSNMNEDSIKVIWDKPVAGDTESYRLRLKISPITWSLGPRLIELVPGRVYTVTLTSVGDKVKKVAKTEEQRKMASTVESGEFDLQPAKDEFQNKLHSKIKEALKRNDAKDLQDLLIRLIKDNIAKKKVEDEMQHKIKTLEEDDPIGEEDICSLEELLRALEQGDLSPAPEDVGMKDGRNSPKGECKKDTPFYTKTAELRQPSFQVHRGAAVIINNINFNYHNRRDGSEEDIRRLGNMFERMGMSVVCHEDKTGGEMISLLKDHVQADHSRNDCFVCCIMSHGCQGKVYGSDGVAIDIKELIKPVTEVSCPSLSGKPKIFLIQACRGERELVFKASPYFPLLDIGSDYFYNVPNIYLSMVAQPCSIACRSETKEKHFIKKIINILAEERERQDLITMMSMVMDVMNYDCGHSASSFTTLTRKLYFV